MVLYKALIMGFVGWSYPDSLHVTFPSELEIVVLVV